MSRQINEKNKQPNKKRPGNIYDVFVKNFFGRVFVFCDVLINYAEPNFVCNIDLDKITAAPTHYIGEKGDERILDLVFWCPLKNGLNTKTVVLFEHVGSGGTLDNLPIRLHSFASAIWWREAQKGKKDKNKQNDDDDDDKEDEPKEQKELSSIYFMVLRVDKKPLPHPYPQISDKLPKDKNGRPIGYAPDIHYTMIDLPAFDFANLRGGPVSRLGMGILKKMAEGAEEEFSEVLLPLIEIKDEQQQVIITKEILDFVAKVFAARGKQLQPQTIHNALTPIFNERMEDMIPTIFDELRAEGRAEGEARGRAEGEARGRAEGEARGRVEGEAIGEVRGKTEFGRNAVLSVLRK
ncbi:MAG: Rpn family recombination-promoting nuclease/putative transposase, partial [Planctomycetaceae bacterium]|nr:Rpn family recombination-promoting nuclease/putative transposase [Planctomycetaceae bacterium]